MGEVKSTLVYHGASYDAEIFTIKDTMLGYEDHGIFTSVLYLRSGSTVTTSGGFSLDSSDGNKRIGHVSCGNFITNVLRVAKVRKWEDVIGERIFLLSPLGEGNGIVNNSVGIASLDGEEVFIMKNTWPWED